MQKILITKTPPGFASLKIRQDWVGCIIPLVTTEELSKNPLPGSGIGQDNKDGFLVLRSEAIKALRQNNKHQAADFWESLPLGKYLRFKKEVCDLLK